MRSLIPQFSHVLVGNCSPFVAEALRYVVGDRSNFRVGVNPAESRHREDARRGMPRRSRYNDLGDICCMRIVYCPGAGNGSVGRNRTDAGPIVATYTGAFKKPFCRECPQFHRLAWAKAEPEERLFRAPRKRPQGRCGDRRREP